KLEAPKPVARPFGFEDRLRNNETNRAGVRQVPIRSRIQEEHRQVLFASSKSRRAAGQRKEAVADPEWLQRISVIRRQTLPIHPRRISDNEVHLSYEKRCESVLDDSSPHSVLVCLVELYKLFVQARVQTLSLDRQALLLTTLDEFLGRVPVSH